MCGRYGRGGEGFQVGPNFIPHPAKERQALFFGTSKRCRVFKILVEALGLTWEQRLNSNKSTKSDFGPHPAKLDEAQVILAGRRQLSPPVTLARDDAFFGPSGDLIKGPRAHADVRTSECLSSS